MFSHLPRVWPRKVRLFKSSVASKSPTGCKVGAYAVEHLEQRILMAGTGLAGAYFARTNHTLAKFARVDASLNFNWSAAPPSAKLGSDGFSVRWTGRIQPHYSGTYTFIATSRGGLRLWINNSMVIDAWSNHALREDRGTFSVSAGKLYNVRLDYWTNGLSPIIKLEWQSSRQKRDLIPTYRMYPASLDKVVPTKPARLRALSVTDRTIEIAWDPSVDAAGVVGYDVYVGSTKITTTPPGATGYTRTGLNPLTGYTFSVRAIDPAGNVSDPAITAVTTAAPPQFPPTAPAGLHVTSVTRTTVSLSWSASTDDVRVAGYRVYRNDAQIAFTTETSFTDENLSPGTSYTYKIQAIDDVPLVSEFSNVVSVTTLAPPSHDPFAGFNASDFDSSSGIVASGSDIIYLDDGDWVGYENVQFGSGVQSVRLQLALPASNRGGYVELRLDSLDGPRIATHYVQPTGSWDTYFSQQLNVSPVSGTHNLYLVFKGRSGVANLRSVMFSSQRLTQIMALGDSITQQSHLYPSYRYYLWKKLLSNGYSNVDFVGSLAQCWDGNPPYFDFDQQHEGHSGLRADQIASNAAAWASAARPDIVLLHIGTNDIIAGQSTSSTIDDITQIISALQSVNPSVKILLAQIIPITGYETQVAELNAAIAGLASSSVIIVDQNTGFASEDLADGVHPNSSGDSKIADRWFAALVPLLQ